MAYYEAAANPAGACPWDCYAAEASEEERKGLPPCEATDAGAQWGVACQTEACKKAIEAWDDDVIGCIVAGSGGCVEGGQPQAISSYRYYRDVAKYKCVPGTPDPATVPSMSLCGEAKCCPADVGVPGSPSKLAMDQYVGIVQGATCEMDCVSADSDLPKEAAAGLPTCAKDGSQWGTKCKGSATCKAAIEAVDYDCLAAALGPDGATHAKNIETSIQAVAGLCGLLPPPDMGEPCKLADYGVPGTKTYAVLVQKLGAVSRECAKDCYEKPEDAGEDENKGLSLCAVGEFEYGVKCRTEACKAALEPITAADSQCYTEAMSGTVPGGVPPNYITGWTDFLETRCIPGQPSGGGSCYTQYVTLETEGKALDFGGQGTPGNVNCMALPDASYCQEAKCTGYSALWKKFKEQCWSEFEASPEVPLTAEDKAKLKAEGEKFEAKSAKACPGGPSKPKGEEEAKKQAAEEPKKKEKDSAAPARAAAGAAALLAAAGAFLAL